MTRLCVSVPVVRAVQRDGMRVDGEHLGVHFDGARGGWRASNEWRRNLAEMTADARSSLMSNDDDILGRSSATRCEASDLALVPRRLASDPRFGSYAKQDLVLIDGFAGPGRYRGGEKGSPLVMLDAYLEHSADITARCHFYFIEENVGRAQHLRDQIAEYDLPPASKSRSTQDRLTQSFRT